MWRPHSSLLSEKEQLEAEQLENEAEKEQMQEAIADLKEALSMYQKKADESDSESVGAESEVSQASFTKRENYNIFSLMSLNNVQADEYFSRLILLQHKYR